MARNKHRKKRTDRRSLRTGLPVDTRPIDTSWANDDTISDEELLTKAREYFGENQGFTLDSISRSEDGKRRIDISMTMVQAERLVAAGMGFVFEKPDPDKPVPVVGVDLNKGARAEAVKAANEHVENVRQDQRPLTHVRQISETGIRLNDG